MNHNHEMNPKQTEQIQRMLQDAFEPMPPEFGRRIDGHLHELWQSAPNKTLCLSRRKIVLLTAAMLLLIGAAMAVSRLGVQFFWTQRLAAPKDAEMVAQNTVIAASQQCEGGLVHAELRDALWQAKEENLSFAVHVRPLDAETYALLSEGDIGVDGQRYDQVWWKDDIVPFAQWAPEGKTALVMELPEVKIAGRSFLSSWDWLPEENGETFLLGVDLSWMAYQDAASLESLALDGLLPVTITIPARISAGRQVPAWDDPAHVTTLTAQIPLPGK